MEGKASLDVMISLQVGTMKESALLLKAFLEKSGLRVWLCTEALQGGDDYRKEIVSAVKSCRVFLPLINAAWARSGECADEFGLAKRLNLTSHERGVTKEPLLRVPIFCPVAFSDLVWNEHPHVELLAANTNFIVHNGPDFKDGDVERTFQQIALSLATVGLKMDLRALGLSVDQAQLEKHIPKEGDVGPTTKQLIQELTATIQQQTSYLRSLEQKISNAKVSNFIQELSPHLLRPRYIGGCANLHNGCEKVWSLEFTFKKEETKEGDLEVPLTGTMLAKCIHASDFAKTESSAAEFEKMQIHVANEHHAIVRLEGGFVPKRGLVYVDAKEYLENEYSLIALCCYRMVMNLDGTELVGVFDRGDPQWTATIRVRAF